VIKTVPTAMVSELLYNRLKIARVWNVVKDAGTKPGKCKFRTKTATNATVYLARQNSVIR